MMAYTYYQDENRISGKQIASIAACKKVGFSAEDAVREVAELYNVKESYIWGLLEYWKEHPNEPQLW